MACLAASVIVAMALLVFAWLQHPSGKRVERVYVERPYDVIALPCPSLPGAGR